MTVSEVIGRLQAIDQRLPEADGVRYFNDLYLQVTERVHALLRADGFDDPPFLRELDERFADLYLEALKGPSAAAWTPLLDAREDRSIKPTRFMLAGINAHVNYDLPIALVDTCRRVGGQLVPDTARHHDFRRIDQVLAEVEQQMHRQLQAGHLEEKIALWGVARARDRAWNAALELQALPAGPKRSSFLDQLGRLVAHWSELLLHLAA